MEYIKQVGDYRIYYNNLWVYDTAMNNDKPYAVEMEICGCKRYAYFEHQYQAENFAQKMTLKGREAERLFICK